ncbi:hypothetical protein LTS18_006322 [Coniosporium uncinatum]|uniref:Uncharacterized protein n=1 Tax=Coniosporium uncinatum TaxID=93489 RepID=A0ACC3DQ94_9PEZI|nr:hypothetical protein LTS18_006322 [Coniosporium uncinatum]
MVCQPPSYGFLYTGGYTQPGPDQTGLSVDYPVNAAVTDAYTCCASCYQTPGCFLYYLHAGNGNACSFYRTTGGSAPDASAQCPNRRVLEYANVGTSGYFGYGSCSIYVGPP